MKRAGLYTLAVVLVGASIYYLVDQAGREQVVETPPVVAAERATQVLPPQVLFRDITVEAGIDFVHVNGAYGDKLLPETMGGGVAFLDYDNDGDQDLLLVNSQAWPGHEPHEPEDRAPATQRLYRNDGEGRFSDVTRETGLDLTLYGMGVAVADYDGDGWVDLYLTAVGRNHLLRNRQGRFEDVTAASGTGGKTADWSSGAAFFDADGDGDLDLFVANYVQWDPQIDYAVDFRLTGVGRAYGPPNSFAGAHPYLFRNEGDGRFTDISGESGVQVSHSVTGEPIAKALGVRPLDIDRDGDMDLFVGNDTVRNFLFRNLGQGRFEEVGAEAGIAFDRNGGSTGAMGVDVAQFRDDNDIGIAVGNFANEMTSFYVTQGIPSLLTDESIIEGIGPSSRHALTFGLFFFDYDLDGGLDLLQANGHLEEEINKVQASQHYQQPAQLYWNCGEGCVPRFVEIETGQAGDLHRPVVGRGAAYADIDGDGDLDMVITQVAGRPLLLRNDQALGHHWLRLKLRAAGHNRNAIGARIEARIGDRLLRRVLMPSRGYLSQSELPVTLGLGSREGIDALTVHWPDGQVQDIDVTTLRLDGETLIIQSGG